MPDIRSLNLKAIDQALTVVPNYVIVDTSQRIALDGSLGGTLTDDDIGYTIIDSDLTNSTGELSVWVYAGDDVGFIRDQIIKNGATHIILGTQGGSTAVTTLLDAVSASGAGSTFNMPGGRCAFQATGNCISGNFSTTVRIEVSNDDTNWEEVGSIYLEGTSGTFEHDGFVIDAPWAYVRGWHYNPVGTGVYVSLFMGI